MSQAIFLQARRLLNLTYSKLTFKQFDNAAHCTLHWGGMELDLELSPLPKGRQERCVTTGLWWQCGRVVYEIS